MTEEHNPWTTRSCDVVYDNPWIEVSHHEVTTPTGSDGVYGVVRFKNLAIAVVPIDEYDHTWLVGQYRYAKITTPGKSPKVVGRSMRVRPKPLAVSSAKNVVCWPRISSC